MADDTPRIAGTGGSSIDTRTDERLRESEKQLAAARALQRISTWLISEQHPEALCSYIVDAAMEIMGSDAASMQMYDPERRALKLLCYRNFDPVSAESWLWVDASMATACGQALRERARVVVPDVENCPNPGLAAEYRGSSIRALQSTPLLSRSGDVLGMISTHWHKPCQPREQDFALFDALARQAADLIERVRIETSLRQSESRNAFLLKLGDALRPLPDAIEIQECAARLLGDYLDVERCYYLEMDARAEHFIILRDYVRSSAPSVVGAYQVSDWPVIARAFDSGKPTVIADTSSSDLIPAQEREGLAAVGVSAFVAVTLVKRGRMVAALAVAENAPREWTPLEVTIIEEVAERTWAAVERARAEQRQKLLLAELQHRVRNILASVRSVIQRSSQSSDTLEDLLMHLEGRIDSMARTQVVLTRNPGVEVDLEDLVREELLSQATPESQVSVEGPQVRLPSKAAEVLNLAVHELATNSIKYGALAARNGRVVIAWRLNFRGEQPWLRFAWIESGVRVVAAAPRREGFGAELITRRIPYELGGTGAFELKPGGSHCIIEFPLADRESILETEMPDLSSGREQLS